MPVQILFQEFLTDEAKLVLQVQRGHVPGQKAVYPAFGLGCLSHVNGRDIFKLQIPETEPWMHGPVCFPVLDLAMKLLELCFYFVAVPAEPS